LPKWITERDANPNCFLRRRRLKSLAVGLEEKEERVDADVTHIKTTKPRISSKSGTDGACAVSKDAVRLNCHVFGQLNGVKIFIAVDEGHI
jgi:hypothetical protein